MQSLRMKTELLPELVAGLGAWGTVWAPVERAPDVFALEVLDDPARARPDALRTILPFKKILLKPSFVMLEGSSSVEGPRPSDDNDRGRQVLFGAHSCDVHALRILDLLHLSDFVDPYYRRNREQLTVIGYGCWPDEHCFCQSLDTSTADAGFDLFLTPLSDCLLVAVATSRGDDIVRANAQLFEPATRQDTRDYLERLRCRREAFQLELDIADLPFVLELKSEDPVWSELGTKCLCCGSCSLVCPTCSCFDVMDVLGPDDTATRRRTWDSCLHRDYAVVAGGYNFRADRADRVRNRYYHKQSAFVREYGIPSCVGCGRCIENCPTGINVVEVFQHVRGDV
jgi:sulfhydrogenase subunit beta (sulfur reductase)